jgi:hypothetical protein
MKKPVLITLIFASLLFVGKNSNAQDTQGYRTAAGLKFGGYEDGFAVKYFLDNTQSIEGVLGFRSHGVVITGLYELNMEAFGVHELKFYYGAGAHIGAVGSGTYQRFNGDNETFNKSQILLGIDGVIGLEYIIPKSPVAVSLDLNPRAELATGPFFDIAPGLGVKYTF